MSEYIEITNALDLINEKKFVEAKEILTVIVENYPDNVEAIKSLGLCNVNLSNYNEAFENFKSALKISPDDAVSWYYIGSIQESNNDLDKACASFEKVISLRENYVDAYKSLGVIYLKLQRPDKLVSISEKFIELAPDDYQTYYLLALAYMSLKKSDVAIGLFEKAIELNPQHAILYNNLGTALVSTQQFDEGIEVFNKAIEIDTECATTFYNVGIAYQTKQMHKQAYEYLKKAYELEPSQFYLNAAAFGAFNAQVWDDAAKYYTSLIYANPEKQNYQYNLACVYQAMQEYQKAISLLENLTVLNANTHQISEKLADVYIEINNFEAAKNIYANMLSKGKVSSEIYYKYAMLCAKTDDTDKAEIVLKKVIQLDPKNVLAHKDLAIIFLSKRLFDYAKEEFEIAYKIDSKNPAVLFEYGNYWHINGDYAQAKKYYDKLLKLGDITSTMALSIGINYLAMNKVSKAIEILTESLKRDNQNVYIMQNLAKAYFMQKKYDVAKQLLEDAYFLEPTAEGANFLGLVSLELKQFDYALKLFETIAQAMPQNTSNLFNVAKCYIALNNKDKAKEYLDKVLEIFPESEDAIELKATL